MNRLTDMKEIWNHSEPVYKCPRNVSKGFQKDISFRTKDINIFFNCKQNHGHMDIRTHGHTNIWTHGHVSMCPCVRVMLIPQAHVSGPSLRFISHAYPLRSSLILISYAYRHAHPSCSSLMLISYNHLMLISHACPHAYLS